MIKLCWERTILGPWSKLGGSAAIAVVAALLWPAGALAVKPVKAAAPQGTAGLTALSKAIQSLEWREAAQAETLLQQSRKSLPKLNDYTTFYLGLAEFQLSEYARAAATLEGVWTAEPSSPLAAKAAHLAAQARLKNGQPDQAVNLLREHWKEVQHPQTDLTLAMALEAAGKLPEAAAGYQAIYYQYPTSDEAAQAEAALARLREAAPRVEPQTRLARAQKLMEAGNTARAKRELAAMAGEFSGADRELVEVRLAAADYFAREDASAWRELKALRVSSEDVEAERTYYLISAARRLDRAPEMQSLLAGMAENQPRSVWRREALVAVANYFLVANQPAVYVPLYRAYYETFPQGPQAAYSHWKVTWRAYLERRPEAAGQLRYHVKNFPGDERACAALYFLGRLSEEAKDFAAARAWFKAASGNYPNFYYGMLSRQKLNSPAVAKARESAETAEFLAPIPFPHPEFGGFEPAPATRARIERSRLLFAAQLNDLAEAELRYGARTGGQGHLLAMELAERCTRAGNPAQGLRWIKALAPNYLYMPLNAAPQSFWKLAFPLPFKNELARNCKAQSLDPYIVAALVRQESEFDPAAVSRSNAYGLTQVMPATGRGLSRKVGIRKFRPAMLFNPDTNLKVGTFYFRALLNELNGQWEATLASYNAGKSRVVNWMTWSDYREPAEFVESIPFTETRNYVQVVLRNADVYRRLYGENAHAALAAAPHIPVKLQKASYTRAAAVKAKGKKAAVRKAKHPKKKKKRAARQTA